jgi:hypothetical protein
MRTSSEHCRRFELLFLMLRQRSRTMFGVFQPWHPQDAAAQFLAARRLLTLFWHFSAGWFVTSYELIIPCVYAALAEAARGQLPMFSL